MEPVTYHKNSEGVGWPVFDGSIFNQWSLLPDKCILHLKYVSCSNGHYFFRDRSDALGAISISEFVTIGDDKFKEDYCYHFYRLRNVRNDGTFMYAIKSITGIVK